MMESPDKIHTGTVVALAFGGQGIIRHEGLVVFVPFTAIGDTISFQITSSKKNYAQGCLVEVLEPSSSRVVPPCPYFGRCGGCQLQHLDYAAQLEAKRVWVEEALQRSGGWKEARVPPVTPATSVWHYRRRVAFHMKPVHTGFAMGYIGNDNTTTLEVKECPIFTDTSDTIIADTRRLCDDLQSAGVKEGRVNVLRIDDKKYVLDFHFTSMPKNAQKIFSAREGIPDTIAGITAMAPGTSLRYGTTEASLRIEGIDFSYSSRTFMQNHPEQSLSIYRDILEQVGSGPEAILDLYCGIGISSLLLARAGRRVVGVESNEDATRLAQENARANDIASAEFVCADVAAVLGKLLGRERDAIVLVNPPREGLFDPVREALRKSPPKKLLYISCMPATLARDLSSLKDSFAPTAVYAYDMFPQTTHVETILTLQRL